MFKKTLIAAAAGLAVAGGVSTSAMAAYDLTGGPFTATAGSTTFWAAGIYYVSCSSATYTGDTENVPGDPASMEFTPSFSPSPTNCRENPGYPMVGTVPHPWKMTVVGEPWPGTYDVRVTVPGDTLVEFEFPIPPAYPCRSSFKAPPGGLTGQIVDGSSSITWTNLGSVEYDVSGCFFVGTGTSGAISSPTVSFPGLHVDVI